MDLETPIVIPAVPAESFDKFMAANIEIVYDNGTWRAKYIKKFYREVDGKRIFAPRHVEEGKEIRDVVAAGAEHPLLLAAFAAIEAAIIDLEA